jgi:hypothetical protein
MGKCKESGVINEEFKCGSEGYRNASANGARKGSFMTRHSNRCVNRLSILFPILLATAACLPVTSKSPVGSTAGYKPDPQLTGMWKTRSDGSPGWFAFFPQADGSTRAVMIEPSAPDDKGGWMVFEVRTAVLGADRYMDASEIEADGKPPEQKMEHVPVRYSFGADGSLSLYLISDDAAKEAIRSGRIAGTVESGQFGDVTLTASPAALDAFLGSAAGRALFDKPAVVLERVKS